MILGGGESRRRVSGLTLFPRGGAAAEHPQSGFTARSMEMTP